MSIKQKVSVCVVTYNAAEYVVQTVGDLVHQDFDKIIVCDDNSTDDTLSRLRAAYGDQVTIINGLENVGAGGNRNRALQAVSDGLLLFVDVDMEIMEKNDLAKIVKKSFVDTLVGVVGYGIIGTDEKPMSWNFGDLMHPIYDANDTKIEALYKAHVISRQDFIKYAPNRAKSYRMMPSQEAGVVGWVAEGCFAVRVSLFSQIGGFAAQMRYHETHDLNARIQEAGFKTIFDSTPIGKHLGYDARGQRRDMDERNSKQYYYQKHWSMSQDTFNKLFD